MGDFFRDVLVVVVAAIITVPILVLLRQTLLNPCRDWAALQAPSEYNYYRLRERKGRWWIIRMWVLIRILPLIDGEYLEWRKRVRKQNVERFDMRTVSSSSEPNYYQATHYPAFLNTLQRITMADEVANKGERHDTFLQERPRNDEVEFPKYVKKVHQATDVEFIEGLNCEAYRQRILCGYIKHWPPSYVVKSYRQYLYEHKVYPIDHIGTIIGGDSERTERIRYRVEEDGEVSPTILLQRRPRYRRNVSNEPI